MAVVARRFCQNGAGRQEGHNKSVALGGVEEEGSKRLNDQKDSIKYSKKFNSKLFFNCKIQFIS